MTRETVMASNDTDMCNKKHNKEIKDQCGATVDWGESGPNCAS